MGDFFDFLGDAFQSVVESPITSLADAATSVVGGALGLADNAFSSLFGDKSVAGKMATDAIVGGGGNDAMTGIMGSSSAAPSVAKPAGIIGGVQDWMKQNPIAAMTIAGAISNAFSPNAIDVQNNRYKNQMELEEWRRKYAGANTKVDNVRPGIQPSGGQLTDSQGNRAGIMRG